MSNKNNVYSAKLNGKFINNEKKYFKKSRLKFGWD